MPLLPAEQGLPRFQVSADGISLHNIEILNNKKESVTDLSAGELFKSIKIVNGKPAIPASALKELWALRFTDFPEQSKGVFAVSFELYLNPGFEHKNFLFMHSATDAANRLRAVQKHSEGFPKQSWETFTLFMPEFWHDSQELDFYFYPIDGPLNERKRNFSKLWDADVYVHAIRFNYFQEPDKNSALAEARKHYQSLFEKTWSRLLLLAGVCGLFFFILIRFFYSIGVKFLLGFLFPFIFAANFLFSSHFHYFQLLEEVELYNLHLELQRDFFRFFSISEQVDEIFTEKLLYFYNDLLKLVEELRKKGHDFSTKKPGDPIDDYLLREMRIDFHNFVLRNSHNSYFPPGDIKYKPSELQQKLVVPFHDITKKELFPDRDHIVGRSNGGEMLKIIQDLFTEALQEVKLFDYFINSPGRLLNISIGRRDLPERSGRLFWFPVLEEQEKELWFLFGHISRDYLKNRLTEQMQKQAKDTCEFYFSSFEQWPTFPVNLNHDFEVNLLAALTRQKGARSIIPVWENNHLHFYMAGDFEPYPEYIMILKKDGDDFYRQLRRKKNFYYFLIWAGIALFWLVALLLSHQVTRPLVALQKGLALVMTGELSHDIMVKGKDQFAELTRLFNEMIDALREKELISGFISKMALHSIQQKDKESVRENVSILFCGILNTDRIYEDSSEQERMSAINEFLCLIQNCIAEKGGYIDKFTGQASLSVFREGTINPVEVALLLIKEISRLNIQRKSRGEIYLQAGIGIATGPVVLGHVGSLKRKDFTAIGNTVNMAARLEALSENELRCGLMIDDVSYEKYGLEFEGFVEIEGITIKGKTQKQRVYEWRG